MSLEPIRSYVIRRVSLATGVEREMEIMLTEAQYKEIQPFLVGKQREAGSRFIQEILPAHSPAEREFLISGTTPEERCQLFGEPE